MDVRYRAPDGASIAKYKGAEAPDYDGGGCGGSHPNTTRRLRRQTSSFCKRSCKTMVWGRSLRHVTTVAILA